MGARLPSAAGCADEPEGLDEEIEVELVEFIEVFEQVDDDGVRRTALCGHGWASYVDPGGAVLLRGGEAPANLSIDVRHREATTPHGWVARR